MKLLTVATDIANDKLFDLISSADKFGWNLEVIVTEWKGFGTKLIETYNHLQKNPHITEFIFVDAYDVIALSSPQEVLEKIKDRTKMLISVEKNCWPNSELASQYPKTNSEWKYINSGSYYSPSKLFIDMIESYPPLYIDDDQLYLTNEFLNNPDDKVLDYDCEVFQAYSFIADDDFGYENKRLQNLKTKSQPVLIHSNGRTDNTKILDLL
jgi:hypothetical protein